MTMAGASPSLDGVAKTDPCGCPDFTMSRRRLLATAAAGTGTLAAATMFGDSFRQVAYGAAKGGHVVVVLSLRGGSDGLSIVVPTNAADQAVLANKRPDLVIPTASVAFGDGSFGFHPALAPLKPMWDAKTFGAVHGVGLPMSNRSHFDAQIAMEDADPGSSARVGWINRMIGSSAPTRATHPARKFGDPTRTGRSGTLVVGRLRERSRASFPLCRSAHQQGRVEGMEGQGHDQQERPTGGQHHDPAGETGEDGHEQGFAVLSGRLAQGRAIEHRRVDQGRCRGSGGRHRLRRLGHARRVSASLKPATG